MMSCYYMVREAITEKNGETWEKVQTGREGGQSHSTQFPTSLNCLTYTLQIKYAINK